MKSNTGIIIKNGTTTGVVEHFDIGSTESISQLERFAASYDKVKIENTANLVAAKLNDWGYSSVQNAIKNGTKEQLSEMLNIFRDNMFSWTQADYSCGSYSTQYFEGHCTTYIEDCFYSGKVYNSTYEFSFTNSDRYSVINDYGGNDTLYLDEANYSFLFDVEIDSKGNLLNYSRDFYIKFAGEEAKETGVVINFGREEKHAIEQVRMSVQNGEKVIFAYNADMIDEVRQEVAGWLYDNGYGSVQDVLHSENNADIESMMAAFIKINNYEQE